MQEKENKSIVHYVINWIIIVLVVSFVLFFGASLLTNTQVTTIVWEDALQMLGFSTTISTVITCTQFLADKLK